MSGKAPAAIFAAGGLLWRQAAGRSRIAVVHRPRHGDWSLPKGKLEPGERWQDAALREVREETGCGAALGEFAGVVLYEVLSVPKIVLFWNMTLRGTPSFAVNDEVDELAWLEPEDAGARLVHEGERAILAEQLRGR